MSVWDITLMRGFFAVLLIMEERTEQHYKILTVFKYRRIDQEKQRRFAQKFFHFTKQHFLKQSLE